MGTTISASLSIKKGVEAHGHPNIGGPNYLLNNRLKIKFD